MKQSNYKKDDPIVVEITNSGFSVNIDKARPYITYPLNFHGLDLAIQFGNIGDKDVTVFLNKYIEPKDIKKEQKYKEVKESQHITQNGCWCPKCESTTRRFVNYMKRKKYGEVRIKDGKTYTPRNGMEKTYWKNRLRMKK